MSFLDSVTSSLVVRALDMSWAQHQVVANNVANAKTEGFRPVKFDFDLALKEMSKAVSGNGSTGDKIRQLDDISPDEMMVAQAQENVRVDAEMFELTKNTLYYQGLISARKYYGEMLSLAISGGK